MKIIKENIKSVAKVADESMKEHLVPGLAMAFIENGKLIDTMTLGEADPSSGKMVTRETHFEAASLTKPVFAKVVMELADEGLIDLDRPLWEYVPEAMPSEDPRCKKVTAKHVLSHATGFPGWGQLPVEMAFDPGTAFGYSGVGYTFLQRVVEKITGQRLDDLMQKRVFNPLKMDDAAMIWTGPLNRTLARTVDTDGRIEPPRDGCQHSVALEPNCAFSLHVTIQDYPKFMEAVLGDEELIKRIYSHINPVGLGISWGLGWGIYKDIIWHWGDNGGFKSFVGIDPKTKDGILIHTNGFNGLKVCYDIFEHVSGMDIGNIGQMVAYAE